MDDELEMDLEMIELGDAKEETKSEKHGPIHELDPQFQTRSND